MEDNQEPNNLEESKEIKLKLCKRCYNEKETSEFFKHKLKPDGLQSVCKSCSKDTNDANKENISACKEAWRIKNADILKAKRVLNKERDSIRRHDAYLKRKKIYRII